MASIDSGFWRGKRVYITGHTGFKGSWLCLLLQHLGAELKGYALSPATEPALFLEARVAQGMTSEIGDVRDLATLTASLVDFDPEIVIHMAAQPLVLASYERPIETYETNIMGTAHLLEAVRHCPSVRAVVNVTTDKCYENNEWAWGYREADTLGGRDPYSSSKACAELVTAAYRESFLRKDNISVATARAGNVIGGGDWAENRLIPDILRAFEAATPVVIRNHSATRPWQHVLEPLSGYLMLAERLFEKPNDYSGAWNFGPYDHNVRSVGWILDKMTNLWPDNSWRLDSNDRLHEATSLKLDISKASDVLGWKPTWDLVSTLEKIVSWHRCWAGGGDVTAACVNEINAFIQDINDAND